VSGSDIQVVGGTLTTTSVTVGANTELAAFNGAVLTVSSGTIGKSDAVGATAGGTAQIVGPVVNSGFLEAIAPGLVVLGGSINNTNGGILPSGSGAVVALSGATVSGGQWQTASGGLVETASGSHNVISGAGIVSGSIIEVSDGGELALSGAIANAGTFVVSVAASAATLDSPASRSPAASWRRAGRAR
jgi:hypothetical protein